MATDLIFGTDLQIADGDLVVGQSDQQHVEHLLLAHPGAYKNATLLGIGINSYLSAPMTAITKKEFERNTKLQLESDGAKQVRVKVGDDYQNIEITAKYD